MHRGMLNLGILAHVDAGKTTLTERLLYSAGVIAELGSVDEGTTQTDSLALERQRGITIKSAVASFTVDGVTVNLIDTPGHPDFIAEVERALSVLDGVVLVVSAVEGVQPQTRILWRALQRLRVPTVFFVNKIDRRGAGYQRLLDDIAGRLTPSIVSMGAVRGLGTGSASFIPACDGDAGHRSRLAEVLAEHDDAVLAAYLGGSAPDGIARASASPDGTVLDGPEAMPYGWLREKLAGQVRDVLVHPVYFGSAATGAGVDALLGGLAGLMPAGCPDAAGPVSGRVFKIERGAAGEKVAYARLFSGSIAVRDRVEFGRGRAGKVTAISVFTDGTAARGDRVSAGQIARLSGLPEIQVGDVIGAAPPGPIGSRTRGSGGRPLGDTARSGPHRGVREVAPPGDTGSGEHFFAPPTLETAVVSTDPRDRPRLHAALTQLAEQDPLINVRQDDLRQEIYLSLYGEVQKQVIEATLADDYGVAAGFQGTTPICVERPAGSGVSEEVLHGPGNPFLATLAIRIEPAAAGSGLAFRLLVGHEGVPLFVYKNMEGFAAAMSQYVTDTLRQGLYGWQVTDCVVSLIRSGYSVPDGGPTVRGPLSGPQDFRKLTPLVVMAALRRPGTVVCEPVHHFRLECPADTLGVLLPVLAGLRAVPAVSTAGSSMAGSSTVILEGDIPAAQVHELRQQLPPLSRGEGVLESAFDRYEPVRGPFPVRPRTDDNPLDREEYIRRVTRRGARDLPGGR